MDGTLIKKFPLSFRNLTRLQLLQLSNAGAVRSSEHINIWNISVMPQLGDITAWQWEGWLLPKEDEDAEKVISSTVSSNVQKLSLRYCELSDEFFPIVLPRFANVKELVLSGNNFTVIPECIKECHFLTSLYLDHCKLLQEIRGIPPNLKHFYAIKCISLTSSCRSMLLNQELHEAGNTVFNLPGAKIPEWFECQTWGPPISFWFRNKFPAIAICLVRESADDYFLVEDEDEEYSLLEDEDENENEDEDEDENEYSLLEKEDEHSLPEVEVVRPTVIINSKKHSFDTVCMGTDNTCLFDLRELILRDKYSIEYNLDDVLLENEWNHAEIMYENSNSAPFLIKNGIHVLKQESSMEDIQFTDPHPRRKRKLEDDLNSSESQ